MFDLCQFRTYYKEVWQYFSSYIGLFDVDREDVKIINDLNRIDALLHCIKLSKITVWERNTCMLFLNALINTLSGYDIQMYRGGFYGNGVLYIPLPHHAGTPDCMEITLDEFDKWFDIFSDEYKRNGHL